MTLPRFSFAPRTALALLATAAGLVPTSADAQVETDLVRIPTGGLQQPGATVATTGGSAAAVINPAGLSIEEGLTLRYLHQEGIDGGDFAGPNGDGLYLGGRLVGPLGGGFAVEWLRHFPGVGDLRRTTWALALGGDAFSLGAGLHLFSADLARLEDVVSVDVGAMARPSRHLSLGFSVLDVDASDFGGVRLPRRYVGAIGLRPFGDWLTLAVEGTILGGEAPEDERGFEAMRLGYNARVDVLPGLGLLGGLAHRADGEGPVVAQLGVAIDFDHLGLQAVPLLQSGAGNPGLLLGAELRTEKGDGLDLRRRGRVAVVDLDEELHRGGGIRLFPTRARDAMVEAIEGLHRLAGDSGIDALVVKIHHLPEVGQGEAWELRQALLDFRRSGKPVVAFLSGGDDTEYYVATAADRIFAAPEGALLVNGFATRVNFYGETLSLIGVEAEAVKVGAFKNAPDQFTGREITEPHREVVNSILDDLFGRYVREVSESRRMEPETFRAALETGIQSPRLARELGLVDELVYPDELEEAMSRVLGAVARTTPVRLRPEPWRSWGEAPVIAVIPIEGTIVGGSTGGDFGLLETTGAETVVESLRRAAGDPRVRAIVLRIDSSGGDAAGSQRIWRAVRKYREHKPIVAAMGDAAASGGYFAAVGAERIFAAPGTITGSIGIFWIKPSIEGLLGLGKVGSYRSVRGELADLLSIQENWSEAARQAMERYVRDAYGAFVEAVAEGRSLSVEEVDRLAQGRVWTGAQAYEHKLVDELGGLAAALRHARDLGDLGDGPVEYRVYRPSPALFSFSASGLSLEAPRLELPEGLRRLVAERVPAPLLLSGEQGLWALAPFELEIR